MSFDFSTKAHGKWILAGEHAVLRGHPCLVFPLRDVFCELSFTTKPATHGATFRGQWGEDMHLLFWSVVEHGLKMVGRDLSAVEGDFNLENNIPLGVGLGASAALCVALTRWFHWKGWVEHDELFSFARSLEDLFHGESSGVDIVGALYDEGRCFTAGDITPLVVNWQPHWALSYSGEMGITSHCVKQVQALFEQDNEQATRIDKAMAASVEMAMAALALQDNVEGQELLSHAINQARVCFNQWGLATGQVEGHIQQLLAKGALAAKPTGSGHGGYILSLWPTTPPRDVVDIAI